MMSFVVALMPSLTFATDPRHFTGIQINEDPLVRDQYLQVDNLQVFSGSAFTIEMMVEVTRSPNRDVMLASYANGSCRIF